MKGSISLAVLATLSTAIAGPVKHAKYHGHKHGRYPYISANTTAPYPIGTGYSYSSTYVSPSAESSVSSAAVPSTTQGYGSSSIIGSSGPTTTVCVESTETTTDTVTQTVTYTGADAVVYTTTSLSYELVEVIVKYVTVYVTDIVTVPGPTQPVTPNAVYTGPAGYNAPAASSGAAGVVPSTPADQYGNSNTNPGYGSAAGAGNSGDSTTITGNGADAGSSNGSGSGSDAGKAYGNGSGNGNGNDNGSGNAYGSSSGSNNGSGNSAGNGSSDDDCTTTSTSGASTTSSALVQYTSSPVLPSSSAVYPYSNSTAVNSNSTSLPVVQPAYTTTTTKYILTTSSTISSVGTSSQYTSKTTLATTTSSKLTTKTTTQTTTTTTYTTTTTTTTTEKPTTTTTTKQSVTTLTTTTTTTKPTTTTTTTTTTKPTTTTTTTAKPTTTTTTTTTTTKPVTTTTTAGNAPPAPTGPNTVSGCTEWYVVKSGEWCALIASKFDISLTQFYNWNPSVGDNCNALMAGYAYCVSTSKNKPTTTTTPASEPTSGPPPSGDYNYKTYTGDGTTNQGWPYQSQWLTFEQLWNFNLPTIQGSCHQYNVPLNSDSETASLKNAIQSVSSSSGVDARFILAIVLQESNGCVRVPTTDWTGEGGHANPGLMQTNQGTGSCNRNGNVQDPCPDSEIKQMITDGTTGTASGDGLEQCMMETNASDVSKYYKAARIYNGGLTSWTGHKADLGTGCCTLCYSSDIANRLTGWHSGLSTCTLGLASTKF
ncbi:hypothetical protein K461DRAFT_267087 [Myriangium duriaei CBS 260.36]|uniref:LysM domain-containing protein n=1 Tax=Myriangium duriaei CBS 260.36 TaxID=1168546 RepID=A0A9P4J4L8_9PEZI|nr:hypothetical protein K461DRAFT_267087 [Myriangium duriaei CBS 260.36]